MHDEEAVAAGETVDLDIWVFHPDAVYAEPMDPQFAFSEASEAIPAWMGDSILDESDPNRLILTMDTVMADEFCDDAEILRTQIGTRRLFGVSAHDLSSELRGELHTVTARLSMSVRMNEPFLVTDVIIDDNTDVYIFGGINVCDSPRGPLVSLRHINGAYGFTFDPER